MNREVLDRWCERGILGLVLAILVFGPLATGAVGMLEFLVIQTLTLGVMLLWGARLWINPRPKLFWPPVCWAVVAFTLYAIARYLTSDIEYVARQELLRVLVYAFLFFAILNNLHRQEATQLISFTLIFLAMAISFYAIYQFLKDSDRVWHFIKPYKHRGSGTYISPNHLGGFLEMLLPLSLAYTLISRLKPVAKVVFGYAALVLLAGIAVTVSRGSWLATGLALAVFFTVLIFHRSHRLPSFVLLVLLLGAGVFLMPRSYSIQARVNQLFARGKLDDDLRFALWKPAIEVWGQNIWWGAGPAHFDFRFRPFRPDLVQARPYRAHNDYLNTLADWGVVGAALVAAAWALLAVGVAKTWRFVRGAPPDLGERKTSNKFAFVLGASLGLFALLVHSAVDFNMHIPANAIVAITLMALLSSHLRFATERYWVTAGRGTKVIASVVLLGGIVWFGQQGWRRAAEYACLERAARAPNFSPKKVASLEKALAAEPKNPGTAYRIGEALRVQSLEGGTDFQQLATRAMDRFALAMKLNPWDAHSFLGYGLCLDWLGRQSESWPYFDRAEQLDPNSYFVMATIGLHFVESGDYAAAKPWFERSLRLQWLENDTAHSYLNIANQRLSEAATNEIGAKLQFLLH